MGQKLLGLRIRKMAVSANSMRKNTRGDQEIRVMKGKKGIKAIIFS